ncbi:MAG: ATP-binding protein [Bacteroidales bacterium]|nr:ATP-binding protein [Bacteroidales bacterium]
MLTKFAVKNYRGFAERIEWDLSHPSGYDFCRFAVRNGTVKNGIIYGPNGSGKTNLGLAIFDIANHLSHKWKKPDYYDNYACASTGSEGVEFEYSFNLDSDKVEYGYTKVSKDHKGEIVREWLTINGEELIYKDEKNLRLHEQFGLSSEAIDNLKKSGNNISIVSNLLMSIPFPKGHVILKLRDFVENMLFFRSLEEREFVGLKEGPTNIEEYIIRNGLIDDFSKFLKETSKQEYNFLKPNKINDKLLFCGMGRKAVPFQMVASTGTRNLELQYYWLKEMKNASFVFIDEFDAFYHYELSYEICKRLFELENQVFVSTHDTFLLTNDLLRPDCFFLLKDNKIKALCDCTEKEIRIGHNLEKLFRGGAFEV